MIEEAIGVDVRIHYQVFGCTEQSSCFQSRESPSQDCIVKGNEFHSPEHRRLTFHDDYLQGKRSAISINQTPSAKSWMEDFSEALELSIRQNYW